MEAAGLGELLRRARAAKGLTAEMLARELNLSPHVLLKVESEAWESLPAGQARPLARQVAQRLEVDLDAHREAFERIPGATEGDAPDPRDERIERIVMGVLTVGCAGLLAWLLIPGPDLRRGALPAAAREAAPLPPQVQQAPSGERQAYPVLGEVMPEAPRTEEGTLVSIRVLDACRAHITGEGLERSRDLRVSEPWRLRIKGPFTLALDNAGVATVEVGGRRIRHGQSVGEPWTGKFGADGQWLRTAPPIPDAATGPETEAPPEKE
jgi:transcriptional regulator with XRE-family HTH domain